MEVDSGLLGVEETQAKLAEFAAKEERALADALEWILRQMCNFAKKNGAWLDHTSNLRNSISVNLSTMKEWEASNQTIPELKALVSQNETPLIQVEGDDYVGCLSAGMEYAIFLETTHGISVLTGAIDHFEPLIEKYFADKMAVDKLDLIAAADIQYSKFLSRKGLSESDIASKIQAKHDYYNGR